MITPGIRVRLNKNQAYGVIIGTVPRRHCNEELLYRILHEGGRITIAMAKRFEIVGEQHALGDTNPAKETL